MVTGNQKFGFGVLCAVLYYSGLAVLNKLALHNMVDVPAQISVIVIWYIICMLVATLVKEKGAVGYMAAVIFLLPIVMILGVLK